MRKSAGHGRKFSLLLALFILFLQCTPVKAQTNPYIKIQGVISNFKGEGLAAPTGVNVLQKGRVIGSATVGMLGAYEVFIPSSEDIELSIQTFQGPYDSSNGPQETFDDVVWSSWKTTLKGDRDQVVNFQLPQPVKATIKVVDAQDQIVPNSWLVEVNGNPPHNAYRDSNGLIWTGIQRWNVSSVRFRSKTGLFTFYYYPADVFDGVRFGLSEVPSYFSGDFPLLQDVELKLCIPINFGTNRTMPSDCFNEKWAAQKAIIDAKKIKADYDPLAKTVKGYQEKISEWFVTSPEIWAKEPILRDSLKVALDFKVVENPSESDLGRITSLLNGSKIARISGLNMDFKRAESLVNQKMDATRVAAEKKLNEDLVAIKIAESAKLASSKKKRSTIVCIKGTTVIKVTDVTPRCPTGFKKK